MPPRSYSQYRGVPLAPTSDIPALARMPGPGAIWNLLVNDAPPTLHAEGFDGAFVDTLDAVWQWPGATEFGVVVLLRPFDLNPVRATEFGGYIIDVSGVDPDSTVYASDPEVAQAVRDATCWEEARPMLPSDYKSRLESAVARIERYMDLADSLRPLMSALDDGSALAPNDLRYAAGVPLFKQTPEVQRRLAEIGNIK